MNGPGNSCLISEQRDQVPVPSSNNTGGTSYFEAAYDRQFSSCGGHHASFS